jgi:oligopeptidase B
VDHRGDEFFILTNKNAPHFRLVRTSIASTSGNNWQEVVGHREGVTIDSFALFKNYLVLSELANALVKVRIIPLDLKEDHYIEFPEPAYAIDREMNPDFESVLFRFGYSSFITPQTTFDYNMGTRELHLVKRKEVPGGYNKSQYVIERLYAPAPDGTKIPISLTYKKDLKKEGHNPCWLYGYGSYGSVIHSRFAETRISLLDRGFVFAMAHIRGGGDLGRSWYDAGKYFHKKNTFADFISSAEHLIREGYTEKEKLIIKGGSAGGLLMGAVLNMRPDLFQAAIASVPFVDVVNTMLDSTLPLTVMEYEEWGNPNDKPYYDYMLAYSPYDNVTNQGYPNLLVTAGLNDPRVQYWEPAKWVAKLRVLKTDTNTLLLKTYMEHGHMGSSGRYNFLKEVAFEYAFALDTLGIKE